MANIVQTFFVDPNAVQQASHVLITSVDLYVKSKPSALGSASGILNPGIVVSICPVENDAPVIAKKYSRTARRAYDEINTSTDSTAMTTFGFSRPVVVVPGQSYGIVITTEDDEYVFWQHTSGDRLVGTNEASPGLTGAREGKYYQSSAVETKPVNDVALKFRVSIADFAASSSEIQLVNDGFEFLTIDNRTSVFVGGEKVFSNTAPIAGTVRVVAGSPFLTGTGTTLTSLTERQDVVIASGNTYHVNQIKYITNTTHLELQEAASVSNTAATLAAQSSANCIQQTIRVGPLCCPHRTQRLLSS